jgi:hypothetical protein
MCSSENKSGQDSISIKRGKEMKSHDLKCWPEFFDAVRRNDKRFELRRNDRDFGAGDLLMLHEWEPGTEKYTGRVAARWVHYILKDWSGLEPGFCVMSIDRDPPGPLF